MLLALYGVGRRSPLGTACGLVALASIGTILPQPLPIWEVGFLIVTVIEYAAAVYIGRLVTGRTRLNARLELQLQRQRRRQALDIEERVRAERTRIAREMHDLVAHAMSLMVVQAGAARMVARDDQGEADRLLAGVEASAHDALDELEHLVALLRSGDDDRADELPIAADLDALVEQVRRAGLHLDYRVEGPAAALNRSQQVSLYRVAQEALTNVRKHAHGSAVAVRLRYHPERVRLEVINRTRTNGEKRPLTSLPGAGHGLIGMRERITLLGGSFSAEARDGGFVVLAELPVKAAAPSR
jgi:signal transduction histidine kinase